ncbi:carbohydrate binding domain-containing protein [Niabella defluvii]|nr:carbohydrate binding domain-containing protein [Niabella sp. I65]
MSDAMTAPTPVTFISLYSSNFSNPQADGWKLYNNDASASSTLTINNGKAVVTISSAGTQTWYIQLMRHNTPIEAGKTYRLTFNAASDNNRNISLAFQQSSAPGWFMEVSSSASPKAKKITSLFLHRRVPMPKPISFFPGQQRARSCYTFCY